MSKCEDKHVLWPSNSARENTLEQQMCVWTRAHIRMFQRTLFWGTPSAPFWCLCQKLSLSPYTLIKFYYTKALSDPALSLAPDWIRLLWRPRIPVSYRSATTFHLGGSSGILQDRVRMLGALVLCSPSEHIFCCTLLTLWCACMNEWNALREASEEPCSVVPGDLIRLMAETCRGFILICQCQEATNVSFGNRSEMGKACGPNSPFSVKLFSLFDHFITPWELEVLT